MPISSQPSAISRQEEQYPRRMSAAEWQPVETIFLTLMADG